jgi:hypothetical protein
MLGRNCKGHNPEKGPHLLKRAFVHTIRYLRANALALAALFVALGGTGYAAAGLNSHTASTRQPPLKAHGQVVAWAVVAGGGAIYPDGHVVAGAPRPQVRVTGTGSYKVTWKGIPTFPNRRIFCAAPVTVDSHFSPTNELPPVTPVPLTAGSAVVSTQGHVVYVQTLSPTGQPTPLGFEVALICRGT